MTYSTDRAAVFALASLGGQFGHQLGDYLIQPDWCAAPCANGAPRKQQHTRTGRLALAVHAASYAATQHAARWATYRAAGVRVPAAAQLAATVAEGVLHAVVDDGRLLRRFAHGTGKGAFHDNGGRALMDQAVHLGAQIPVGAAITALLASTHTTR